MISCYLHIHTYLAPVGEIYTHVQHIHDTRDERVAFVPDICLYDSDVGRSLGVMHHASCIMHHPSASLFTRHHQPHSSYFLHRYTGTVPAAKT